MTIRRRFFPIAALAFAAATALCAPALGDELTPTDFEQPRTRLQEFTDRASELVMRAMGMIGIRYKYGGVTPEGGMDCSGLVRYVYKEAWGLNLPRTSEEISRAGQRIDTAELQPGDLVFYNTLRRTFSHVGIYLGDKKFLHAPSSGGQVRIESMDLAYWKKRFNGARRLTDPEQSAGAIRLMPPRPTLQTVTQDLTTVPAGPCVFA
jgi:cell wall-associated NlpC family hydrolase